MPNRIEVMKRLDDFIYAELGRLNDDIVDRHRLSDSSILKPHTELLRAPLVAFFNDRTPSSRRDDDPMYVARYIFIQQYYSHLLSLSQFDSNPRQDNDIVGAFFELAVLLCLRHDFPDDIKIEWRPDLKPQVDLRVTRGQREVLVEAKLNGIYNLKKNKKSGNCPIKDQADGLRKISVIDRGPLYVSGKDTKKRLDTVKHAFDGDNCFTLNIYGEWARFVKRIGELLP